jgi:hypothetical protein
MLRRGVFSGDHETQQPLVGVVPFSLATCPCRIPDPDYFLFSQPTPRSYADLQAIASVIAKGILYALH